MASKNKQVQQKPTVSTKLVSVGFLSARVTPNGFAITLVGKDEDGGGQHVDVTLDWLWFPMLATELHRLLKLRDQATEALRSILEGRG